MKTWKSFVKRNIEWMILSAVLFFLHVLYLFLIGRTGDDLIYAGILDLCIIAAAVCMAYIRYYRKVRYLKGILQQPFSGELKLPETEDLTEELLEQLLSNAVKYTPGGELTIEVQEEPQQIWLKIRDTGIGIRSEDIPRVFEKGYTGFNGHEDKRSTGIGLYLCRDALQKLGHTIRIQSEIGEGTVVTVGFYKDTIDVRD